MRYLVCSRLATHRSPVERRGGCDGWYASCSNAHLLPDRPSGGKRPAGAAGGCDPVRETSRFLQVTVREEMEAIMAKLRILSHQGDTIVEWDEKKAEVGDPEALEAIREAERIFEEHKAKGATAFKVDPGKPAEKLERFDKTAEQIVMVPRVAGG